MTALELIGLEGYELARYTDEQLLEHLRPYFPACRPAAGGVPAQADLPFDMAGVLAAIAGIAAPPESPPENQIKML